MNEKAFSLIELMIVVAILAIIVAIAIPAYQQYTINSADRACLYEAKGYSNYVFVAIQDGTAIFEPSESACDSITSAVGWTNLNHTITAFPKSPGGGVISCVLPNGGSCSWSP